MSVPLFICNYPSLYCPLSSPNGSLDNYYVCCILSLELEEITMKYVKNCLIITLSLGIGYSQCNESNWQEYYFSEGHNMEGCNLEGADLSGAFLQWATLDFANLEGANLQNADLSGVYLRQANLLGANLLGANLSNTNLCNLTASPNGDECEELDGFTDDNNDGYDDVSYEAGYSDGVIFGMESVDITIDNQAVCEDCYEDGEASVDTNSDGLVDEFPVITILGGSVLTFTQNHDDNYVDPGAICFSDEMNYSQNVEVSGDVVNLSTIGNYIITYNCSDNEGNQAMSKSRTVIILADYTDIDNDGFDDMSYDAGAMSGDLNLDAISNVLDIVILANCILADNCGG